MMAVNSKKRKSEQATRLKLPSYGIRRQVLLGILALMNLVLVWWVVDRQVLETEFLQREGARRYLRVLEVPADRGMITDRNGEPLAVSTPVDSIWADPRELHVDDKQLRQLAKLIEVDPAELKQRVQPEAKKGFVYLRRRVSPDVSEAVRTLKLPGIHLDREYRRFYPAAEVTGQVVGFTNIDDVGQEGIELAFEKVLAGTTGKKMVLRDGRRRIISDVESIQPPRHGERLRLSLDLRLQYMLYRELKAAVEENKALAGTAILLDTRKGEVLAMANLPSYNPNGDKRPIGGRLRNRTLTDIFEPGSTIKPFIVAAALESGQYQPTTQVDTNPGSYKVGGGVVRDVHNYGVLDLTGIIRKSSNVGVSKLALSLPKADLWNYLRGLGIGSVVGLGFPAESTGQLAPYQQWRPFEHATISFGYGLSVSAIQLARAYAALANDGAMPEIRLLHSEQPAPTHQVMRPEVARTVRQMLGEVVTREGTAPQAAVPGYRVGGKTGTAKKAVEGGYASDRYQAVFAGIAPLDDPRLVLVVMIDEPRGGKYYGGLVAAPVFSKVMAGALRMLDISPDEQLLKQPKMANLGGGD